MKYCMYDMYRHCQENCVAFYVDEFGKIYCERNNCYIYTNKKTLVEALKDDKLDT